MSRWAALVLGVGVAVAVGESELEAQGVSVGRGRGRGGGARTVVLRWQEQTGNKRYMCYEIGKNYLTIC